MGPRMRRTLAPIPRAEQPQKIRRGGRRAGEVCSWPRHPFANQMSAPRLKDTPAIQSLDRGLAILEAVATSAAPVPLKLLTDLIGIDRSSVFRLANTLRQRRFLANPRGSKDYILGPTAWRLSRRYGRSVLGTFFHHYLEDLSATLGETSHFAVHEGVEVFFIDHHMPSGQIVSVAGQTG